MNRMKVAPSAGQGSRRTTLATAAVAFGIAIVGLFVWWIVACLESSGDGGRRSSEVLPPTPPAVVAEAPEPQSAAPVEVARENVTPAAESPKPPAARPTEVALTAEQRRQVDRINKLVPGVSAEILDLVQSNPARFAELVAIVETARTSIGELQMEAYRIQDEIVAVRLREGRFEAESNMGAMPSPLMPGEVVHSMVVYDSNLGRDIRKVFRIIPGESADFDLARSRMENEKVGIARVVKDYLSISR